ncbi:MAG TPA: hypothetical protein VKZ50_12530 [bacterium]|nr:hypothetical protein [bacterium]
MRPRRRRRCYNEDTTAPPRSGSAGAGGADGEDAMTERDRIRLTSMVACAG